MIIPEGIWQRARDKLTSHAEREGFDAFDRGFNGDIGQSNPYNPLSHPMQFYEWNRGFKIAEDIELQEKARGRP